MDGRRDELSYTERTVIESIRRGQSDGDIAQRLGISIVEVKSAVDRLMARYGKADRAGLATVPIDGDAPGGWEAPPARGAGDDLEDAPGDPGLAPLPLGHGDEEPTYSRRAVLGMIGVGAATLAGIGAYYLTGRSDSRAPARPDPFATNTPPPTATPQPTATPHPGTALIKPAPDAWVRRTFANGQPLDMEHGIAFVNTETGETEAFQVSGTAITGFFYKVSPRNDVIAYTPNPGQSWARQAMYRRSTGESFDWDANALELVTFSDELAVFHRLMSQAGGRSTGAFDVVDRSMQPVSQFELSVVGTQIQYRVVSRDGEAMAFATSGDIYLVDVPTGTVTSIEVPEVDGWSPGQYGLSPASELRSFDITAWWYLMGSDETRHFAVTINSLGEVTNVRRTPEQSWLEFVSPDGRYRIEQGSIRENYIVLGDNEHWVYTELFDNETQEPLFRVLSGHLAYGMGAHRRWLADSSGFLVQAQDVDAGLENYHDWRLSRRYYIVRPTGELEVLPKPEVDDDSWYIQWSGGPEPAPDNPDLFSLGGVLAWERSSGRWLGPREAPAPNFLDPWGESSREMRFSFPLGGRDSAGAGTVLSPVVERPPYRDAVTLMVARAETCVNLREHPATNATIVNCLPDGTRATVVDPPVPPFDPDVHGHGITTSFFADDSAEPQDHMFVHVRTDAGQEGWVAIQYLDWA